MARAYKCDLCKKLIVSAEKINGFNIESEKEYRDEFTETYRRIHEVHEICKDCHGKIMETVISLYVKEDEKKE